MLKSGTNEVIRIDILNEFGMGQRKDETEEGRNLTDMVFQEIV